MVEICGCPFLAIIVVTRTCQIRSIFVLRFVMGLDGEGGRQCDLADIFEEVLLEPLLALRWQVAAARLPR